MRRTALYVVIVSFFGVSSASATVYVGPISAVLVGATSSGTIRVSVQLPSAATTCGNPVWYAYEYPDAGVGKVWTAELISAQVSGHAVRIDGTGICDGAAVEGVGAVTLQ